MNYTKLPAVTGVPEKIQAFNLCARFIYWLRHPIETIGLYSHTIRHHASTARYSELFARTIDNAVEAIPGPVRQSNHDRDDRSFDAPSDRYHAGALRRARVDAAGADVNGFAQPENVTPEVIMALLWGGLPRRLKQSSWFRDNSGVISQPMHTVLRRFTVRQVRRHSVDQAEVALVRPVLYRQTDELARLLGCDFSEWTNLMNAAIAPSQSRGTVAGTSPLWTIWGRVRGRAY